MIRFLPPRRRRLINLARDGSAITRISPPPPRLKEDHRRPAAAAAGQPVHQSSTVNNEPAAPRPSPRPPLAFIHRTAAAAAPVVSINQTAR